MEKKTGYYDAARTRAKGAKYTFYAGMRGAGRLKALEDLYAQEQQRLEMLRIEIKNQRLAMGLPVENFVKTVENGERKA